MKDIDTYIQTFPKEVQEKLNCIRNLLHQIVPEASETISYGMPTFKLNGNLVHFAAYKNHIGFYPTPSAILKFEKELAIYNHSKGAVQFPIDKPLPIDLIEKMVRFRVKEQLQKKKK
ncbi:MAG: DUF1801 domain-containing protein [Flavobacteriaceae bacterium]|jgi:uncharacterized protein YdhG (YjbR/CyaY superfamily)|nr:DUF1801 domain-containing protein [Flavobacteriaceae bacterium]MCB0486315.1 DUF1801 domain-containing protein [Flavobacteriaceae bacterium]